MSSEVTDLEIDQDITAQKRMWLFQRFGIGFMIVFVILSLLGVIAPGGLLHTSTSAGNRQDVKFTVHYDRTLHYGTTAEVKVEVATTSGEIPSQVSVAISRDYLEALQVESVTPEPTQVVATGDGYKYIFHSDTNIETTKTLLFFLKPNSRGKIKGVFRAADGSEVEVKQFIFP